MPEKFFNLEEAERLLPEVERLLRSAIESKKSLETADQSIGDARQHIMSQGGSLPDRATLARARRQREQSAAELQEALQQIGSSGVLVKDLDVGLIDFPCLMNDREVYLCWKLGEGHIEFWHHVEDGFAGRKPVDKQFLEQIRRNKPN
jgi:hypothetical protein